MLQPEPHRNSPYIVVLGAGCYSPTAYDLKKTTSFRTGSKIRASIVGALPVKVALARFAQIENAASAVLVTPAGM